MTTQVIAERFVELCRQGQFEAAQKELFSSDVVSVEPYGTALFPKETRSLEALLEKARKFTSLIEQVHSLSISDPLVAGNAFAIAMKLSATIKGHGHQELDELCVYEVKDGKIVSERFTSRFNV